MVAVGKVFERRGSRPKRNRLHSSAPRLPKRPRGVRGGVVAVGEGLQ